MEIVTDATVNMTAEGDAETVEEVIATAKTKILTLRLEKTRGAETTVRIPRTSKMVINSTSRRLVARDEARMPRTRLNNL